MPRSIFRYRDPVMALPRRLVAGAVAVYQATLSPDHGWGRLIWPGAGCRFYPTCSEYTTQAVRRYGVGRGLWLALTRLGRCHPWARGGFDPLT